jgi:hypothetical protein
MPFSNQPAKSAGKQVNDARSTHRSTKRGHKKGT